MRFKIRFLVFAFAVLLAMQICLAAGYESLPPGLEVKGIVGKEGNVLCTAQIVEHATLRYFEHSSFEEPYYIVPFDSTYSAIANYEFPALPQDVGKELTEDLDWAPFAYVIPYDSSISGIIITDAEGEEKCRVERSVYSPQIQLTYPLNSGSWETVDRIEWVTSDEDTGDLLLVDVYWADNLGLGWDLLEYEVEGSSLSLPEPIEATRIMAVVSDGFNIGTDIVESSLALGAVDAKVDYEEEQAIHVTSEDDLISADDFDYQPREYDPLVGGDGNVNGNGPVEFDFWSLLIYGIVAVVVVAALFFVARGKGAKKKDVK